MTLCGWQDVKMQITDLFWLSMPTGTQPGPHKTGQNMFIKAEKQLEKCLITFHSPNGFKKHTPVSFINSGQQQQRVESVDFLRITWTSHYKLTMVWNVSAVVSSATLATTSRHWRRKCCHSVSLCTEEQLRGTHGKMNKVQFFPVPPPPDTASSLLQPFLTICMHESCIKFIYQSVIPNLALQLGASGLWFSCCGTIQQTVNKKTFFP